MKFTKVMILTTAIAIAVWFYRKLMDAAQRLAAVEEDDYEDYKINGVNVNED
jgi:aspartate/glutamate racemase